MPTPAQIKQTILAQVSRIPAGRVATFAAIGRELKISPRLVATTLATLTAGERATVPWHRVVADGGAIGRHKFRDAQIERLVAEGIAVSPAGIVDGFAERLMSAAGSHATVAAQPAPSPAGSRSRGMKGRPSSTT